MSQWHTMLNLFNLSRNMCADMAAGIPAEQMDDPQGESNSPNWILGHLALSIDFGLKLLGENPPRLERWMPVYGPGSPGGRVGDSATDSSELLEHIKIQGDHFHDKLQRVDAEHLAAPQQTGILTDKLPTNGDMLGHLVTTHIAMHTGQLSQWRRAAGLPSILTL